MLKPLYLNTATGAYKATDGAPVAPRVFDFDVEDAEGQTAFPVTEDLMTETSYIEVLVNGRGEMREGAAYDFTRDVGSSQIVFNFPVPFDAWVRIKIYPFGENVG